MTRLLVVVPVRDGAPTLARCLGALVTALPLGAEIVVVDDGSRDDSAEIARRFPVRILRHAEPRGASAARNTGAGANDAELIAFVDADVVLRPDALARLVAPFAADPTLLGTNGLLALDLSAPGLVSAFANTSIHYQHLCHGTHIASAFTSLCVLRRDALTRMGGWEEDTSRFADDVATRFHLPAGSIRLVPDAQGEHLKVVSLPGLLKHRFNIGYFFVRSVIAHWGQVRERPAHTLLAPRYPLNTLNSGLYVAVLAELPRMPTLVLLPLVLSVLINARFVLFTLRARGLHEASLAGPISTLEGFAYISGMAWSATVAAWRANVRASATSGPVRAPLRPGGPGEPPPHA